MELRVGYKQTEVGVIPNEWNVMSINSLTPPNQKYSIVDGPFGSNLKTIHYRKSGIPVISSGFVTNGYFNANEYVYVDVAKFKQEKRSAVRGGDIVMAKIGENCGASAILPSDHQTGILSGNALKISIDSSRCSVYFIWQLLLNLFNIGKIDLLKTTGAQPAISITNLKKFLIPVPAKSEQTAIAQVLSDTDELISSLEKLIEKKKLIKQGTMQQLLTGKKRLPGFRGEWVTKPLTNFLEYEQPTNYIVNDTEYDEENGIPVLTAGKTFILGYTQEEFGIFSNLPVIIFDDFTTATKFVDFPFKVKSSAMKILKPRDENVNLRFIYEMMQRIVYPMGIGDHKRHWIANYQFLEIAVPEPKEQNAISELLSDMETEINLLEHKLNKYKSIKQGMMQNLLTGKIRLV